MTKTASYGEIRGKRLAVIGGNNIMQEVSEFARANGLTVATFAKSPRSAGHRFSDEPYYVDCKDPAVMLPLLREKNIDGVLAFSGEKLLRQNVGWLSRSGYHYYCTETQWDILMNKRHFKEYAARFGIPAVPEYPVDTERCTAEPGRYPVAVKPADNGGSSGVSICPDRESLTQAIRLALENSATGEVLCEKFLEGDYFQFEVWMQDGQPFFPYVKERIFYPPIGNLPTQPYIDIYPSSAKDLVADRLFAGTEAMLGELGVRNGSCMFQGIIEDGIPYIMDVAFRLSGGMDFKVVREETGVDLIASHILLALTGRFGGDLAALREPWKQCYAIVCIGLKNGRIASFEGLDAIAEKPWVFDCFTHYKPGDTITSSGRFSQTAVRLFLKAESREKLGDYVGEIAKLLDVKNEDGESMLLPYPEGVFPAGDGRG